MLLVSVWAKRSSLLTPQQDQANDHYFYGNSELALTYFNLIGCECTRLRVEQNECVLQVSIGLDDFKR